MLVIPCLIWPILFGQNHLKQSKAVTDYDELTVYFKHPSLRFQIKCVDSNLFAHFPNLSNQTSSLVLSGLAYITCLLTGVPPSTQPSNNIVLKRGFNLVTLCLVMASSLVGNPLFANQLWIEGSQLLPGVQVLSCPIDLKSLSTSSSLAGFPNFSLPSYNDPKCRPSKPLSEPDLESTQTGILLSQDHMNSPLDFSDVDFQEVYQTTVLVRSNKKKITLPLNSNLGVIRPKTSEDDLIWHKAAEHTAQQLLDSWFSFITSQTPLLQCNSTSTHLWYAACSAKTWDLNQQKSETAKAGLDSSVLAPFLLEPESDYPDEFPPLDSAVLDPHSEEYFNELVTALGLDSPTYSHVDPIIMQQFKGLLRKYPEALYLPGTKLGTVKDSYHNIDTGQSPPVYCLPYHKSPAELCAIKSDARARYYSAKSFPLGCAMYSSP